MCDFDYSIIGHGWERQFYLCENEQHKSFNGFGGARLLFEIFEGSDIKISPLELYGNIPKEHVVLKEVEVNKLKKIKKYIIGSSMGWSDGSSVYKYNNAKAAIVWDEGNERFVPINSIPNDVPIFWASNKSLPNDKVYPKARENSLLMLDVKVLRKEGILISNNISWERTATDLYWQFRFNSKLSYLKNTPNIIITFGEDAAMYLQNKEGISTAKLILAHSDPEGWIKDKYSLEETSIPDIWTVMVAHAAVEWKKMRDDKNNEFSVGKVLKSAEILLKTGYDPSILKNGEYRKWLDKNIESSMRSFDLPEIKENQEEPDPEYWCINQSFDNVTMHDLANDYVEKGEKVINGIPRFKCGRLITIDRKEIEAYQSIKKLIINYDRSNNVKPLNIAVFGAPGSGKSFGVTEIAENILKKDVEGDTSKIHKLVFNVSQMSGQEELASAFHKVRDTVLNGKLPLVFFDEFDSSKGDVKLGWLKKFLMPMQDGKFIDNSGEHPIGKSIFVFAGGTSNTFKDFSEGSKKLSKEDKEKFKEDFRNSKGTDFVSRLKGTIDIIGPNKLEETKDDIETKDTAEAEGAIKTKIEDKSYILRRALLLKSMLKSRKISDIQDTLRRTLLLLPKYCYGVRSMEAILDMCDLKGDTQLRSEHLPSFDQLSLHVDEDIMKKILQREILFNLYIEYMAELTHKVYLKYVEKLPVVEESKSALYGWKFLKEETKESNREQVRKIPDHLEKIGYSYEILDTKYKFIDEFPEEQIDILAKAEHDRWVKEKEGKGWNYAAIRDEVNKKHPCLVEWDKLPKKEQQKDIEIVKNIIPMFKKAKFGIYKIE